MPAYEYACQKCGDHFSQRQKMSDPELDACPKCGGAVRRLISGGAGVVSKGASAPPAPACGMGGCCSREMQSACGCAE